MNDTSEGNTVIVMIITLEWKKGGIRDIRNQDNKWRDKGLDRVAVDIIKRI